MSDLRPPPLSQTPVQAVAMAPFAALWRRLVAFAIDALVLGVVGLLLGLGLGELFARAGAWGRLVGFVVAGVYFIGFESRLGGATPGKRLLGLRVRGLDGQALELDRAALRYAVFSLPYFLNGAALPALFRFGIGVYLVSLVVFGLGGASLYLLLFDRPARRALHDRWSRSVVLRETRAVDALPFVRRDRVVLAVVVAFSLLVPAAVQRETSRGMLAHLGALYSAVSDDPEVRYAGVSDITQRRYGLQGAPSQERVVTVSAIVDAGAGEAGALPERLAALVLQRYEPGASADFIAIRVLHGYDIGIASAFERRDFVYTPAQWHDRIAFGAEG